MMDRFLIRGLFVLALTWSVSSSWASPQLTLSMDSHTEEELTAQLLLQPVVESGQSDQPTRVLEVPLPWAGDLELGGQGRWRVHVDAPGYWAPPLTIQADEASRQLRLIPTGTLAWKLPAQADLEMGTISLAFESTPAVERDDEAAGRLSWQKRPIPASQTDCRQEDSHLRCGVPSGRLDVRLDLPGFAPVYTWGVDVEADKDQVLGPLPLAAGASLFGHVERLGGDGSTEGAAVFLAPQVFGFHSDPVEHRRLASRTLKGEVDARGYFQVRSIPLGAYDVRVEHEDGSRAEPQAVEVEEAVETRLDTITLEEPLTVEVWLDPPLDAKGRPWRLQLLSPMRGTNAYASIAKSLASTEGAWRHVGASPGLYRLEVQDAHGSVFLVRRQSLDATTGPLFLTLEGVAVRGYLTAADEPIAAELVFGTQHRRPNVRLRSDDEGYFEGYLPREGEWLLEVDRLRVPSVEVTRRSGETYAELDIALPETELSGSVVEGGIPVPKALILIHQDRVRGQNVANQRVEDDGSFTLRGLTPGSYRIRAYLEDRTSDWQQFELDEDQPTAPQVLELQRKATLRGQIVSERGPVAGAWILALPTFTAAGQSVAWSEETVSAADGSFEVKLAPGSTAVAVLTSAPGFALSWQAVQVDENRPQTLVVQRGEGRLALGRPELTHGALRRGALQVPIRELFWMLRSAQRLQVHPEGFPVFAGLEAGPYALCPGPTMSAGPCLTVEIPYLDEVVIKDVPAGWSSEQDEEAFGE